MEPIISVDGIDLVAPPEGRLLPPRAFTSRALYEMELDTIFARSWVHVADLSELGEPGDYVAARIGRAPVLVVRGADGELRGFLNACRHRGATLAEGRGNCGRQLRCPYHAWSYRTDGSLAGVPHRDDLSCSPAGMDLLPMRIGALGPLVMGCLDPHAPPLREWAGGLAGALDHARAPEMTPAFELAYDVAANWKLYVENGLDGYHVEFVHDVLNGFLDWNERGEHELEAWTSCTWVGIDPQLLAVLPRLAHLDERAATHIRFGYCFPNLIVVVAPGNLSYLRIDPVGPEQIHIAARDFDLGGPARDFAPVRQESFDRTNRQDIAVVERVQRGAHAGLPPGVYQSHLERRIAHFEQMLVRELTRTRDRSLVPLRRAG